MTIDEVIAYEKIEASMARRRAREIQNMLNTPATNILNEANEHDQIVGWLEALKAYREGIVAEAYKKDTAEEILEMIGEIRSCQFYCMADLCPGKKDCATCALEYIEKRIKEEYKCQISS